MQLDFSDYLMIGALMGPGSSYSKDFEAKAERTLNELQVATIKLQIAVNNILEKENDILAKNINEYSRIFDNTYSNISSKLKENVESLDNNLQKELEEIKANLESKKSVSIDELVEARRKQSSIGKEYLKKKIKIANDIEFENTINAIDKEFQSKDMPIFFKKIAIFFKKMKADFHQKNIFEQQVEKYTYIILPPDTQNSK